MEYHTKYTNYSGVLGLLLMQVEIWAGMPASLTTTSGYPTLSVVKTDIPTMAPPPPGAIPAGGAGLGAVETKTVGQLEVDLTRLLRAVQPNRRLTERADDGTPKIPSLVAVFLISQVGAAAGRPKLVDLTQVNRADLRSMGGVARLVHRTLHPAHAGPLAS
ncbi:MAG: hypothetical protein ACRDJ4_15040 [Actinomycetota bacterium]